MPFFSAPLEDRLQPSEVEGSRAATAHTPPIGAAEGVAIEPARTKPVTVDDETMIATSFPTFEALMTGLGATFEAAEAADV